MNRNKKVILHIVHDDIWQDKLFPAFERMEEYENRYLFRDLVDNKSSIRYIKNTDKLICVNTIEEWGKIINDPQNDIIYFQGIWKNSLKAIDFIRKDAVVMWMVFGMDIYSNEFGWSPLIYLKQYKPKTLLFVYKQSKSLKQFVSKFMTWTFPRFLDLIQTVRHIIFHKRILHKALLARVDLAYTPLPVELDLLKKRNTFIKAKPYRLKSTVLPPPFYRNNSANCILLEHSAMSNNNHLDLIAKVRKLNLKGRKMYLPVSYGNEGIKEYVIRNAHFDGCETKCLTEVLPTQEYLELLSDCSHALFGTIRQSGLGNSYLLLRRGVKVFYYKDSVLYKQLKSFGFHVFSIEDDLNNESIKEPLSEEMSLHNYNIYCMIHGGGQESYDAQFNKILNDFSKG